ncbi:WD40 repeat-like protein [Anaeromyces robustus]|uniref:WD40 repeat-like protein n=1 Tax=Anaeromyces robustus TaxID=1754192 RepID=A0A1Y1VVZ8_9FUNG|nr:WD40 repeat-like protein [Anaeromyces robustus]|eukprot:ORX65383.1 WD40 repeat-like protein [Anaeromyces robustus]
MDNKNIISNEYNSSLYKKRELDRDLNIGNVKKVKINDKCNVEDRNIISINKEFKDSFNTEEKKKEKEIINNSNEKKYILHNYYKNTNNTSKPSEFNDNLLNVSNEVSNEADNKVHNIEIDTNEISNEADNKGHNIEIDTNEISNEADNKGHNIEIDINEISNEADNKGHNIEIDTNEISNEADNKGHKIEIDTNEVSNEADNKGHNIEIDTNEYTNKAVEINLDKNENLKNNTQPLESNSLDKNNINLYINNDNVSKINNEQIEIEADNTIKIEGQLKHETSNVLPKTQEEINDTNDNSFETIYQFPKYILKKEKTLRSISPYSNPRCSTQNYVDYETKFNNYFKNAKWSPDGLCILSSSNDNILRLFELPDMSKNQDKEINIKPVLNICDGESIYDFCWYPYMNSSDQTSSVFISASRDLPIHMWDAYYGNLRASYCTYDIYDQIVAPHSINFNLDGSKIYAGLNNLIQIFDISRPGEPVDKKLTTPSRKSKHGQKGIIACMDFNPDYSGLLAAGSLSKSIGIYDTNNSNELIFQQKKLKGGVIQVKFSPDGNYLYSVSRQSDGIVCWDIRNTGKKLCEYTRPGKTNQRISFDISKDGKYLISGDKEGYINIYELKHFLKSAEVLEELNNQKIEFQSIKPIYRYEIQKDTITSAAFHPYYSLLFTCSGQRKFNLQEIDNDEVIEYNSDNDDNKMIQKDNNDFSNYYSENILSIWQIGSI